MTELEQKNMSNPVRKESHNISEISGGYILVYAFKDRELCDYFTEFNLVKREPKTKAHIKQIKKLKGRELRKEHTQKFMLSLRTHLSDLMNNGFLELDITMGSAKKKGKTTVKLHHFILTQKAKDIIAQYLKERESDKEERPKKRFQKLKQDWFKRKTLRPGVLEKTFITPGLIGTFLKRVHIIKAPHPRETAATKHLEQLLYNAIYAHDWGTCVNICCSLGKEYRDLKSEELCLKYMVSALYFNWAGRKRYNEWNAIQLSLAMVAFQKNKMRKALRHFEDLYMSHLEGSVLYTFGQIYDSLAQFYHITSHNTGLATRYYLIARNLFERAKKGSEVSRLNRKIKELNK